MDLWADLESNEANTASSNTDFNVTPRKLKDWTMLLNQHTIENERVPLPLIQTSELGQLFWSSLLLVVKSPGVEVSKPKVKISPQATSPVQAESVQSVSANMLSEEEVRVRAYQIYESSDRTNKHADEDWSQAETELMEMLGGK